MISRRRLFCLLLVGSLAMPRTAAFADDGDSDGDDQDRALNAVKDNNAAPLKEILAIVHEKYQGEIVRISLKGSGRDLIYLVKLLDKNNHLIEIQINAVSRAIVLIKGI